MANIRESIERNIRAFMQGQVREVVEEARTAVQPPPMEEVTAESAAVGSAVEGELPQGVFAAYRTQEGIEVQLAEPTAEMEVFLPAYVREESLREQLDGCVRLGARRRSHVDTDGEELTSL